MCARLIYIRCCSLEIHVSVVQGKTEKCMKKCDAHAGVVVLLPYTCYTVLTFSLPLPSSLLKPIFERCPHYGAKDMATEFFLKR